MFSSARTALLVVLTLWVSVSPAFGNNWNKARKIKNARFLKSDDTEWMEHVEQCGDVEYELSAVVVTGHVALFALPGEESKGAGCWTVAFHSNSIDKNKDPFKEIMALEYPSDKVLDNLMTGNSVQLGTYKFSDLAHAYNTADFSGSYDILNNNCATFLVNFGSILGVQKLGREDVNFIGRRLLETSPGNFFNRMHRNLNLQSLFKKSRKLRGTDAGTDSEMIEFLVETANDKLL